MSVASESVFLSALQPNTSVTTYALPSDNHLGNGGTMADEMTKSRRVHEQVQLRLAEKSTLPRQNGSASQYAMSDYGGSSTMKYQTYTPSYSSKSSYMNYGSRTMAPRMSTRSGFSCQSAGPDLAYQKISVGGGGGGMVGGGMVGGGGGGMIIGGGGMGGGSMYREEMRMGGYQTVPRPVMDSENLAMHTMRQQSAQYNPWTDISDGGSLVSERDATLNRQYTQSMVNGYGAQMRQGGGSMHNVSPMRRSLSGTLSRSGGLGGGEMAEMVQQQQQQHSYKGPAHRTISRITNRNRNSSMTNSVYGRGGDAPDGFVCGLASASQANMGMRQGSMSRAMSTRSMQSVGRGADIYGGQMEMGASSLSRLNMLDMATAVQYLREPDHDLQVLGAAYIQHECFNDKEAKQELRRLKGIGELVKLFNSENQEVQRYATGATRNVIYENMDNKVALIEEGGIPQLMEALKEHDDELHKNVTGILWNLSSKDNLKEKLARETLSDLTDKILVPLSGGGESEDVQMTPSEVDILFNTTGCLRNLSSVNMKTRQLIRETNGVVDSLVGYIKSSLEQNKTEDKGMENAVCVLRNLSYHIYEEIPPSALMRLEGPTRDQAAGNGEAIGCFSPMGRKTKNRKNQDLSTFSEVSKFPKGMEWLWNPQIVSLYNRVLHQCEINSTTREAAAGALQNITAGDKRWASVLSRVALEQERMLPMLLDLLRSNSDLELRSLTGLLRNLSRHCRDKGDMATKVVNNLVTKLPADGHQKEPSSDVVVNICGILNNLVTGSSLAARDIAYFDGLTKLVSIKKSMDGSPAKEQAAQAASTVLSNMFHYKKLHKQYKEKGFTRDDFSDGRIY